MHACKQYMQAHNTWRPKLLAHNESLGKKLIQAHYERICIIHAGTQCHQTHNAGTYYRETLQADTKRRHTWAYNKVNTIIQRNSGASTGESEDGTEVDRSLHWGEKRACTGIHRIARWSTEVKEGTCTELHGSMYWGSKKVCTDVHMRMHLDTQERALRYTGMWTKAHKSVH